MWIEKTSKGHFKFVESYKDPYTGKTKRVSKTYEKNTSATRKKAERYLLEKIASLSKLKKDISYNEAVELYLKSIDVKPTTLEVKKRTLKRMAKYFDNGNVLINRLTGAYIRDFYINTDEYISRAYMDILKTMFNWCYDHDYIDVRLFDKVKLKAQKHNPGYEKEFFEKYELEEIFKKLEAKTSYTWILVRNIVEFITLTGLRIGELAALEYSDVNDGVISVTKNMSRGQLTTPKTDRSIRDISINSRANQIILEMKMTKRIFRVESDLIFPNKAGSYVANRLVSYILKAAGVSPSRVHIYRHTHASILAEQGVSLESIQRRLGHGEDKTTERIYIHVTEKIREQENQFFKNLEIL